MAAPEQDPVSPPDFVPNGRKPKGEFKTTKRDKSVKPAGTFKERRAARIAAHQASVASKSRLKEDGERWVDAHQQFTTGEESIVDDSEANTATTWEDISYDDVREAVARQMLESNANLIDLDQRGTLLETRLLNRMWNWQTDILPFSQSNTEFRLPRNGTPSTA